MATSTGQMNWNGSPPRQQHNSNMWPTPRVSADTAMATASQPFRFNRTKTVNAPRQPVSQQYAANVPRQPQPQQSRSQREALAILAAV